MHLNGMAAKFMGTDTASWAVFGWFLARTVSTTIVVGGVIFAIGYFLYNEVVRGFETTFTQMNHSVADIREDMHHVKNDLNSLDVRTAERLHEAFRSQGAIELSLTADIGEVASELRVTNARLDGLLSEIGSTNRQLADFRADFRSEAAIQGEFRNRMLEYVMKREEQ